jgi:hypothetical protein
MDGRCDQEVIETTKRFKEMDDSTKTKFVLNGLIKSNFAWLVHMKQQKNEKKL